jgi:hypothetical protein
MLERVLHRDWASPTGCYAALTVQETICLMQTVSVVGSSASIPLWLMEKLQNHTYSRDPDLACTSASASSFATRDGADTNPGTLSC